MDELEYEQAYEAGESNVNADWVNAFDTVLGLDVEGPRDACEQVLRWFARREQVD